MADSVNTTPEPARGNHDDLHQRLGSAFSDCEADLHTLQRGVENLSALVDGYEKVPFEERQIAALTFVAENMDDIVKRLFDRFNAAFVAAPVRHPLTAEEAAVVVEFVDSINDKMAKEGRSDDYANGYHAGMREWLRTIGTPSPEVVALIEAHREEWRRFDDDRYEESCDRTRAALQAVLAFRPTTIADVRAVAEHVLEPERDEDGVPHTERVVQCGMLDPWLRTLADLPPEADAETEVPSHG